MIRFDNATKEWSWYIHDPALRAASNLAGLSSGDLVWVKTTGTVTVDILVGGTLSCTGEGTADQNCWNQIAIPQRLRDEWQERRRLYSLQRTALRVRLPPTGRGENRGQSSFSRPGWIKTLNEFIDRRRFGLILGQVNRAVTPPNRPPG